VLLDPAAYGEPEAQNAADPVETNVADVDELTPSQRVVDALARR